MPTGIAKPSPRRPMEASSRPERAISWHHPSGAARRLAVAAGAALVLALAAGQSAAADFGSVGRWIVYPDGRVFLPHGLNLVVTRPPYWASWFGNEDARFLASQGFTALRVNLQPQALEPELGLLDTTYLQRFADRQAQLARYGIATLVALNQDGYAEACGGNGFPSWALLGPCESAWAPFWADAPAADSVGLQEHYGAWWTAIASRFAATRGLLGFDLLNEPQAPDDAAPGALWRETVATVRAADPGRLAFVEPRDPAAPSFGGGLPGGAGLAGHVYCASTLAKGLAGVTPGRAEIDRCIRHDAATLAAQVALARRERLPVLVGEFGASDEPREQSALVDAMGEAFVPWLAYAYTARLDSSGAPPQSLLRNDLLAGSEANAKQAKLDALVVPHPLAVAGTPRSWRFDRRRRTVAFAYSTARVGGGSFAGRPATVVFVPRRVYPHGYAVAVAGGTVVSDPGAPWLRIVARAGARVVHVSLVPGAGTPTRTPIEARHCGYDQGPCGLR